MDEQTYRVEWRGFGERWSLYGSYTSKRAARSARATILRELTYMGRSAVRVVDPETIRPIPETVPA